MLVKDWGGYLLVGQRRARGHVEDQNVLRCIQVCVESSYGVLGKMERFIARKHFSKSFDNLVDLKLLEYKEERLDREEDLDCVNRCVSLISFLLESIKIWTLKSCYTCYFLQKSKLWPSFSRPGTRCNDVMLTSYKTTHKYKNFPHAGLFIYLKERHYTVSISEKNSLYKNFPNLKGALKEYIPDVPLKSSQLWNNNKT